MRILLFPLSVIFWGMVQIRLLLYRWKILKSYRLPKPVISVGNITVGGTGKTPFTDYLLSEFEKQGLRCAVLTRGYGRHSKEILVIDEHSSSHDVGDEPLLLFKRHPKAQIIVGADRVKAAAKAKDVDLFILDDGFQNLRVERDYDIVLIDTLKKKPHYRLLPWGDAREPWSSLRRADLVVLTRANQAEYSRVVEFAFEAFRRGCLDVSESGIHFQDCFDLATQDPINLVNQRVGLVSAIANPGSFEILVQEAGGTVAFHLRRADHAPYTVEVLKAVFEKAQREKVGLVLVTEKDAVKIREIQAARAFPVRLGVVSARLEFNPPLENIYGQVLHFSH